MPTHPVTYTPTRLFTCVALLTLLEHPMHTCMPATLPDYPPIYRRTYPPSLATLSSSSPLSLHMLLMLLLLL